MSVIKEGIARIVGDDYDTSKDWDDYPAEVQQLFLNLADSVISYLKRQNVVRRVNRKTTDFIKCPCDDCTAEHKLIDEWGYFCDLTCGQRSYWIARCRGHQDMAGYALVEELE